MHTEEKKFLLVDMEDTLYVSWVTIAWGEYMQIENPVEQRNGRPLHELFPISAKSLHNFIGE